MRIIIDTDGSSEGTVITFGDKVQDDLVEFNFSVRCQGKAKMQMVRMHRDGKTHAESFYANDFEKFGEKPNLPKDSLIGNRVNKTT